MLTIAEYVNTMKRQYTQIYYSLYTLRGKTLLEWAVLWFRMSNDEFYSLYGFNFNPHKYDGLYEIAREMVYGKE
jgi:hypothetical protein